MESNVRYDLTDARGVRKGVQALTPAMADRLADRGWILEPISEDPVPSAVWAIRLRARRS